MNITTQQQADEARRALEEWDSRPLEKWFWDYVTDRPREISKAQTHWVERLCAEGRVFPTEEACQIDHDRRCAKTAIFRKLRELETEPVDWSNTHQEKYHVSYDHRESHLYVAVDHELQDAEAERYTTNGDSCQWLIDNMEAELRLAMGVE